MSEMPSFIKTSKCNHNFCSVPVLKVTSTQLSLNVYDGRINIANDLQEYIKDSEENCSFCGNKRSITVESTTHIIIELNSIPSDLEASTSTGNIESVPLHLIKQNYARPITSKLDDLEKFVKVGDKIFKLRGVVSFYGGDRRGLRNAMGHYTASAFKENCKWETYDDTKIKVQNTRLSSENDVELLFFTV
ncbi:uncharacterized protein LOC132925176 [Rhopalosiphum padi]|uniref:uncharacterized protein LOC132925176 n=1 Tax=Rhopalosiphum padi TaxID=40932 RepID=UPI00298EC104|nr:uncharacterized protein LOC132925176 [Rhopalosiphum padi]